MFGDTARGVRTVVRIRLGCCVSLGYLDQANEPIEGASDEEFLEVPQSHFWSGFPLFASIRFGNSPFPTLFAN